VAVKTLQSVENAFRLLAALARSQPAGTSALARDLDLDKMAVQRILATLGANGWIRQVSEPSSGWQLTARVVLVAQHYRSDLRERARPHLLRLHESTGETVVLFARDGLRMAAIDVIESTRPLRVSIPPGTEVNLTDDTSASYLAFADPTERRRVWGRRRFPMTERQIHQAQRQGYYEIAGAYPGVIGLGAPIRGDGGALAAALVVIAPFARSTAAFRRETGALVAASAGAL
jgi:IclR family transcriptional regulator, acetate operon repressor